jgi:lipoprotein-releasing system permease protein
MISAKVAWRFLTSSKFQTILIVLGIAVGVSVQVFVGSLIQSLQKDLVETTVGNSSQVTITPAKGYSRIADWQAMVDTMNGNALVTVVSVSADGPCLIAHAGVNDTVTVRGIAFADAEGIYGINHALKSGAIPTVRNEILVSSAMADEMSLNPGDSVTSASSPGSSTSARRRRTNGFSRHLARPRRCSP